MLVIQEFHQVAGRSEIPFEAAYREEFAPALTGDLRLLLFGWLPHGGGEGYEAVVLIGANDVSAVDRYQDRLQRGDLSSWWSEREAQRYSCASTLHVISPATALAQVDLAAIPASQQDHGPRMYRLDIVSVPRAGSAAIDQIVASLGAEVKGATCRLWGAWSSYFGDLEAREVALLYRIDDTAQLQQVFAQDDPFYRWKGTVDPGQLVDRAPRRCRLVRASAWSPLV